MVWNFSVVCVLVYTSLKNTNFILLPNMSTRYWDEIDWYIKVFIPYSLRFLLWRNTVFTRDLLVLLKKVFLVIDS